MSIIFLTQEGYEELQQELNYLRTEKRKDVADRLHNAMDDGDLIENAEYEAAKNEQSFVEGRKNELEYLLGPPASPIQTVRRAPFRSVRVSL